MWFGSDVSFTIWAAITQLAINIVIMLYESVTNNIITGSYWYLNVEETQTMERVHWAF